MRGKARVTSLRVGVGRSMEEGIARGRETPAKKDRYYDESQNLDAFVVEHHIGYADFDCNSKPSTAIGKLNMSHEATAWIQRTQEC